MIERKPINVNFTQESLEIIERVKKDYQASFSWAVNQIIREWSRVNQSGTVTIGGNGSDHEQN